MTWVTGEYAVFTISISFITDETQFPPGPDPAQQLLDHYLYSQSFPGSDVLNWTSMQNQLQGAIRENLGADVDLDEMLLRRGSVEMILIAATLYKIVKDSNDVLDTIQKTAERLRRIVKSFLDLLPGAPQRQVTAVGRPGTGLLNGLGASKGAWRRLPVYGDASTLQIYLVISNIVLIVGLLVFLGLRS
jgi:hypothetical protein